MSELSLPQYISNRGRGEQCILPPGVNSDTYAYTFAFRIDKEKANETVQNYLGKAAGDDIEFGVMMPYAFLTFLHVKKLTSSAEVIGYLPDMECGFSLPVWYKKKTDLLPRFAAWMPYVFINNCIGMVTGREVWGYEKEIGELSVPSSPLESLDFTTRAVLFKNFALDTEGKMEDLLKLSSTSGKSEHRTEWKEIGDIMSWVTEKITKNHSNENDGRGHSFFDHFLEHLKLPEWRIGAPVINLKQFRDVAHPDRACFQSLVTGPLVIDSFYGAGLILGDFTLDITPCDSHRIAPDMGLAGNQVKPEFGFWIHMDFSVPAGETIWRSGASL